MINRFKLQTAFSTLLAAIILLWAFGLWTTRLTDPFVGRHDNNTVWLTISARNYLRYGYFDLGLLHTYDSDPVKPWPTIFYNSTPPLPAVLVSFGIVLFGDHEGASRIIPIFMTMIGSAALYTFVRKGFGREAALLALALFLTTPMIAFYGQMVAPEEFVVPFFLLLLLVYQRFLRRPSAAGLALIILLTVLLSLSGWASVFALGGIGLHALFFAPQRARLLAAMTITAAASHAAWLLLGSAAMPNFWEVLFQRYEARTAGTAVTAPYNGFFDFLVQLWWTRMRIRFTEALFALALLGGVGWWISRRQQSPRQRETMLLTGLLLIPAGLYMVVFQQATWAHDYFTYYFAPPLAILGAFGFLFLIAQFRQRRSWPRAAAGLLLVGLSAGLVFSIVRWTRALYLEREDFPVLIAPEIQSRVAPGTPLYSDLPFWPAAWYYSQRDILPLEELPADGLAEASIMTCEADAEHVPDDAVKAGSWLCRFDLPGE